MDAEAAAPRKKFKWGFLSASAVIAFVVVVGELIARLIGDLPLRLEAGGGLERRDWLVIAFFACTAGWAWLSRGPVLRFLRSMHTGVSLIVLSVLAVIAGVLVPQISSFEDPRMRVTPANYEQEYSAFRWAEGYFLYHMLHLYGIGMPEAEIPAPALASLDRFGRVYGVEERENRGKRMEAAFSGQKKTNEIRAFVDKHDSKLRKAFDIATALQLNRAYKSGWFATLITLLGLSILANTFTGKPRSWFSMRRIGFFVTHIGMLVMLVGGGVSKLLTKRGIMHVDMRDAPMNTYWLHFDRAQETELPFYVGLERFARKEWKQISVEFPGENFTSNPPSWTVWPGWSRELDFVDDGQGGLRPRVRIDVREVYDRARIDADLVEASDPSENGIPIVDLKLLTATDGDEGIEERDAALVPGVPNWASLSDPDWEFRLAAGYGEFDLDRIVSSFPTETSPVGLLFARDLVGGEATDRAFEVTRGAELDVPGDYSVQVVDVIPNYILARDGERVEVGERFPKTPAVVLEIAGPDGERERRVVRQEIDPVSMGLQQGYLYSNLLLAFQWDEWTAPGPPRYIIHWGPDRVARLIDENGAVREVSAGDALPIDARTRVLAEDFFVRGVVNRDVVFEEPHQPDPGEVDEDFYARDDRGVVLGITTDPGTPDESTEVVRLVTGGDVESSWNSEDGRMFVHFFENTAMMPFEWRSVLSIWEPGPDGTLQKVDTGSERDSEIRVNDYFKYKGWRMFQTNADARFPTYSGIGMVYDPGIPIVLIGMYTIIAGTVLAFIVRPIVRGRRDQGGRTA